MTLKYQLVMTGIFMAALVLTAEGSRAAEPSYEIPSEAVRLIEEGRFDEAIKALTEFRHREPDNPYGLFYLAMIEQDYPRALWLYREVERLGDSTLASRSRLKRADIALSQERLGEADSLYQSVGETYPSTDAALEALYRRGNICLAREDPEQAIQFFTACIEQDTTATRLLYARAGIMEARVALNQWQQTLDAAIGVLAEQDDMSVMTPRILEVIALSWRNLGNEENAERFIERLLENYPYSLQAYGIQQRGEEIAGGTSIMLTQPAEGDAPRATPPGGTGPHPEAEFTVQAGAFTDRNNALKLLSSLEEAGFDARVEMRTVQETHFFVIRIGYFASRDDAEEEVRRITRATGIEPNVVVLE
ncbi:SPOR domain-containing protein [Candidatus Latescibacterota bacterium]